MSIKVMKEIQDEAVEMRMVFAQKMDSMAAVDKRVVYLEADLGKSIGMVDFFTKYPDRSVNCGIQEANMIGTAAGMSAVGLVPFVHTFGTFATRRVMDQIFVSAAYAKLNVRIIGSDPGITASLNGGTHMPFEDIGALRCIPEVTIIEPADTVMLSDVMESVKDRYGVFYIRLSRKKAQKIYADGSKFEIGKAVPLREGKDVTIFATGICIAEALKAAAILESEGISVAVSNMFTIKPIDTEAIIEAAKKTGAIVTAENHNIINGLGSAVAEVLSEHLPVPLERVGVEDRFGQVGTVPYLMETYGLTAQVIVEKARRAIARKGNTL